jgi:hypothetical protein
MTTEPDHGGVPGFLGWPRGRRPNRTSRADFRLDGFTTPAEGDAYDFRVTVAGTWMARGQFSVKTFDRFITENWAEMAEVIHTTVREHARRFPPHKPAAAEASINDALRERIASTLGKQSQNAGADLSLSARALVGMSEPVQKIQGEVWAQLLRRDAGFDLAKQLGQLRTLWSEVLQVTLGDWTERYALQLAEEPSQTTEVVTDMLTQRRQEAERLLDDLNRTISKHQSIDMLDFVLQTDSALRAIMKTLGMPLPDPPPSSPFTTMADT